MFRFLLLCLWVLGACTPAAVQHVQKRYPSCKVTQVGEEGPYVLVRVDCPHYMEPRIERFLKK